MTANNTTKSANLNDSDASGPFEGSVMSKLSELRPQGEALCGEQPQGQVTIGILPDNVLLDIFDFYRNHPTSHISDDSLFFGVSWRWKILTQVCQRWKYIIFGSPRRLDLHVVCTDTTPTRTSLDIWPPFPIIIYCRNKVDEKGVENIIAAFERCDRISQVIIRDIEGTALIKLAAAMQESLPSLDLLFLRSTAESPPVLPETFLGGPTPLTCPTLVGLFGIPLPTFPKFISSSTRITFLHLEIPNYISPDVMVTSLAALPNLKSYSIHFTSLPSHPLQISPPPLTRAVLPTLNHYIFRGVSEYFEDFIARIDTPLIDTLTIIFFMMDPIFDIPRFYDFIDRTERLQPFNQASMEFCDQYIMIRFGSPYRLRLGIRSERPDRQLSSITQIFGQQLPLLSQVEQFEIIQSQSVNIEWNDNPDLDSSLWLELFDLLIAAQSLYVSERLVLPIAAALRELTGGNAMEVLPGLNRLFLEGLESSGAVDEGIKSFVTSRQISGHPITIQSWKPELRTE